MVEKTFEKEKFIQILCEILKIEKIDLDTRNQLEDFYEKYAIKTSYKDIIHDVICKLDSIDWDDDIESIQDEVDDAVDILESNN